MHLEGSSIPTAGGVLARDTCPTALRGRRNNLLFSVCIVSIVVFKYSLVLNSLARESRCYFVLNLDFDFGFCEFGVITDVMDVSAGVPLDFVLLRFIVF